MLSNIHKIVIVQLNMRLYHLQNSMKAYKYVTWGNMVVRNSKFFRVGISSDTTVTCPIKRTDANLQTSGCTII